MNQVLSKIKNDALAALFMAVIGAATGTAAHAIHDDHHANKNAALSGAAFQQKYT